MSADCYLHKYEPFQPDCPMCQRARDEAMKDEAEENSRQAWLEYRREVGFYDER